jgi:hypothetical protein
MRPFPTSAVPPPNEFVIRTGRTMNDISWDAGHPCLGGTLKLVFHLSLWLVLASSEGVHQSNG